MTQTSETILLTDSQQNILQKLQKQFQLQMAPVWAVAGIPIRATPLLVGPSGCGKTFLGSELAARNKVPYFSVSLASWIVAGAKSNQSTLVEIAKFVKSKNKGIIFIDEVNKLQIRHTQESTWSASLFTELITFLDRDSRLETMGFGGIVEKLKKQFFVFGGAAFQDEFLETAESRQTIGFIPENEVPLDYGTRVQRNQTVPPEIMNRFNDELLILDPPKKSEYRDRIEKIRAELELPALVETELHDLVNKAWNSQKMFRFLEGYACACLASLPEDRFKAILSEPMNTEADGPDIFDSCIAQTTEIS